MSPTIDMPGGHCDIPTKIGVAELRHSSASSMKRRKNRLHSGW